MSKNVTASNFKPAGNIELKAQPLYGYGTSVHHCCKLELCQVVQLDLTRIK